MQSPHFLLYFKKGLCNSSIALLYKVASPTLQIQKKCSMSHQI